MSRCGGTELRHTGSAAIMLRGLQRAYAYLVSQLAGKQNTGQIRS